MNRQFIYSSNGMGDLKGYVSTSNSTSINKYMRTGEIPKAAGKNSKQWENDTKKTIEVMKRATKDTRLQKKTRFMRMVDESFLNYALKLEGNGKNLVKQLEDGNGGEIMKQINKTAGTVCKDKGFISTGYKVDGEFYNSPIMLTLLCDSGQKCFVTDNKDEAEVIFAPGTRYVILGAYAHGENGKKVPASPGSYQTKGVVDFRGIEIVAKIIRED